MIAETKTTRVDIRQGATHLVLRAPLATMDNMAHVFEAQVYDGDAAADLSGAVCSAFFIRADGVTVMLDGTVSGSTASVTLGANCYAVPGRFELAVKLTQGDTVHTILRAEGSVTTSRTDAMTGAGSGVHSFDQLENRLDGLNTAVQQRDRVWNLLDNSDFRNPVNQRGNTTYTDAAYTIDRWKASAAQPVTLTAEGIKLDGTNGSIVLEHRFASLPDGVYTAAVKANNHVHVRQYQKNGTTYTKGYENAAYSGGYIQLLNNSYPALQVRANAGNVVTIEWAAVYPGAYTAETLPAYVPKGYAAELLECQRYYYKIPSSGLISYCGFAGSATNMRATIPMPVPMIASPSITVGSVSNISIYTASTAGATTAVEVSGIDGNTVMLNLTTSGLTAWKPCVMRFNTTAALSADL